VTEPGDVFVEPTPDQVEALTASGDADPIVMVNLLRFKERASAPDEGVSGAEAYARYAAAIPPFLEGVGGRLLAAASCVESIIGPAEAEWDAVALVEYPSRQAFLTMITDPEYLAIHVHREAALADSRLILSAGLVPPEPGA
jgi:uncharacterized protein (DUF1330 family)